MTKELSAIGKSPIEPTEQNLLLGADVYKHQCAVCHGATPSPKTPIAAGMFPEPPQLYHGDDVADDPPEETFWKVANGIRLTGMPGFRGGLKDDQMWQVSLLLAKGKELPASVTAALAAP